MQQPTPSPKPAQTHHHPHLIADAADLWITVTRRFGKPVTVIDGIGQNTDSEAILRDLKQHLATAGRDQHGRLELEGDQASRVVPILYEMVVA